ncbi:MAG: TM2 domain-containing protein [Rhodothermales bacterium]|nr:TM2 domain-containing protein [Rhodothermales bacterium]MBO6779144.1 TM2 domain-containing protein [Rhodothermales bacterium]
MSKVIKYMPELRDEEQLHVAALFKDMNEEQAEQFARVYRQRRKEANITLVTTLLGLLSVAGVQRFYLGQIWMGVLYFLTAGLCVVGTIYDLVNHKSLTYQFNQKEAEEVADIVMGAFPVRQALTGGDDEQV